MSDSRQTFLDIKHVRRLVDSSILRMPGVVAVATGYKKVQGKRTNELAVIVYVAKKLPLGRMPAFHAIPEALRVHGREVITDVVEVGYYIPYSYKAKERPALGGVSIGHLSVTAGTLGGLVCGQTQEDDDEIMILSNNHVLAAINNGVRGDHIVQQGVADGGTCHDDCIAELERFVPIDFDEEAINYVDCAVALPYNTSDVSFEIHDVGYPNLTETYQLTTSDVASAFEVQKTGRTTGHTVGYVGAVDWKGSVLYEWTEAYFERQIVVESLDGTKVSEGGDSGSLVLTMDNKICGLLFAGPTDGQHYIANHIGEVFNRLDVRLCCGPTEATSRTEAKRYLRDIRKLRDYVRADRRIKRHLDKYGRHSGKFLDAMLRDPDVRSMAAKLTEAAGMVIRDRRSRLDKKAVEIGINMIDGVCRIHGDDRELLADMDEVRGLLNEFGGRTTSEILDILRK